MEELQMTPYLKQLLSMMEFIGGLPDGKKLNFTNRTYDDPDSWYDSGRRTLSLNENRKNTCETINKTLNKIIKELTSYKNSEYHPIILNSLEKFRKGVTNIPSGYLNDPDVEAEITVILTQIDLQLSANGRNSSFKR